ncbi:GSCOCG00010763001-RA-CDS [Cotesia congregata]|uniref:Uncharacterized protein n=1 Tax=Cotesia congregata TaxID=51543 RepID=A0A8J2MVD4_COTCN|nr:GSCOCG00010763001-RA-CDS [Cotesia congregata]CAG5097643.1 Protein of unknown function [Cotesia congregata]
MIINVLIILVAQLVSVQGGIQMTFKYAEVPSYNKEYVTEPDMYIYDGDKVFLNYSVIKQFPPTTEEHYVILGASMGEYVVETGFDLQLPLCEFLDLGMGYFSDLLGFDQDNCPPKPGVYGNEAHVFAANDFTDNFPTNEYKSFLEFKNNSEVIMALCTFLDIQ